MERKAYVLIGEIGPIRLTTRRPPAGLRASDLGNRPDDGGVL